MYWVEKIEKLTIGGGGTIIRDSRVIKEFFKRYMDDGFVFWPKHLDFNSFPICSNNLHPAIKYTVQKAKVLVENSEPAK